MLINCGAETFYDARGSLTSKQQCSFLFIVAAFSRPNDSKLLPTLGNGQLGFAVLSDSVYMNGLYNGRAGLSHRARIPNFVNILLADCLNPKQLCKYSLNVKHGYFMVELVVENQFIARHLLYAHRFHNRALINQIHIQRLGSKGEREKYKRSCLAVADYRHYSAAHNSLNSAFCYANLVLSQHHKLRD